MQIPFLGVIAEECEKSLQMGRGQIGCRGKKIGNKIAIIKHCLWKSATSAWGYNTLQGFCVKHYLTQRVRSVMSFCSFAKKKLHADYAEPRRALRLRVRNFTQNWKSLSERVRGKQSTEYTEKSSRICAKFLRQKYVLMSFYITNS